MESLVQRAAEVSVTPIDLSDGRRILVRTVAVRFGGASPPRLRHGVLAESYTDKPLVSVNGDAMFAELAIVRIIERDGWDAVWVDTGHDRKFWRAMPHKSLPVALPPPAQARYDAIVTANGGRASGFFDVMAWRDGEFAFLDYQLPGDPPGRRERQWIEAALASGVDAADLWYVRPAE